MNVSAKFDKIPSMILQDIKEIKRKGHTFVRSFVRTDGRTDIVKTVYPTTNTVCGGYKYYLISNLLNYLSSPFNESLLVVYLHQSVCNKTCPLSNVRYTGKNIYF